MDKPFENDFFSRESSRDDINPLPNQQAELGTKKRLNISYEQLKYFCKVLESFEVSQQKHSFYSAYTHLYHAVLFWQLVTTGRCVVV